MNLKVRVQALKDLHQLKLIIEDKNAVAANKYIDKLLKTINNVTGHPHL